MTGPEDPGAGGVSSGALRRTLSDLADVLLGELLLARAEFAQGARGMVRGAALLAIAAVLGIVALSILAQAAVFAAIAAGLSPPVAGLAVGAALLLLSGLAVWIGTAALSPRNLVPVRALSRLRADLETLKTMVTPDARPETPLAPEPQPAADRGAA